MEPPQQKFLKKVLAKRNAFAEKEKQCEVKEKQKQMQTKKKGGRKKKGSKKKGKGTGHQKQNNTHKVQIKVKAKYPALFYVEVPKFKDGRIQTDKNGNVIFVREYGEYTCYHIAHHEQWKKYLFEREKETIEQLHEFIEDSPRKKTNKKRKVVT